MDVAILTHSKKEIYHELESIYIKVDEIPFDFNRRRMSVVIKDKTDKTLFPMVNRYDFMLYDASNMS